jgi:hypothetical protein
LIRENRHYYDAFLYGFQQEKSISAEIMMVLQTTMEMQLLFFMRTAPMHHVINIDNMVLQIDKHARALVPHHIDLKMALSMEKRMRGDFIQCLEAKIDVALLIVMRALATEMTVLIGTLNRGKVIRDIENLLLYDIQDLTIEKLCEGTEVVYGLRVGLIRPNKIVDIQHLTIAQVQNMTIQQLCFTVIH